MQSMTFYIKEEEIDNIVIVKKDFIIYFIRYLVVIIIEALVVFLFKERELFFDIYNISDYIIKVEYCSNSKEDLMLFNFLSVYKLLFIHF